MRAIRSMMVMGALAGGAAAHADEQAYQVVVSSALDLKQVSRADLADYFMRRELKWLDGMAVMPVDLTAMSEVRRSFSHDVLGQDVKSVLAYWERQIQAGHRQPPAVKASDADVIRFVEEHPGAVGYVSSAAKLPQGVKAVELVMSAGRSARQDSSGHAAHETVAPTRRWMRDLREESR